MNYWDVAIEEAKKCKWTNVEVQTFVKLCQKSTGLRQTFVSDFERARIQGISCPLVPHIEFEDCFEIKMHPLCDVYHVLLSLEPRVVLVVLSYAYWNDPSDRWLHAIEIKIISASLNKKLEEIKYLDWIWGLVDVESSPLKCDRA